MRNSLLALVALASALPNPLPAEDFRPGGNSPELVIARVVGAEEVTGTVGTTVLYSIEDGNGDRRYVDDKYGSVTLRKWKIEEVTFETVGGKVVPPAEVAKRLQRPTAVLLMPDKAELSPTLRKCFKEDTLVLREPILDQFNRPL